MPTNEAGAGHEGQPVASAAATGSADQPVQGRSAAVVPVAAATAAPQTEEQRTKDYAKAGRNLYVAVPVGLALIALVVVTLIWLNWLFVILAAVLLVRAIWEIDRGLRHQTAIRPVLIPVLVGAGATILAAYFGAPAGERPEVGQGGWWTWLAPGLLPWSADRLALGLLAGTAAVCLAVRLARGLEGYIRDVSASLFLLAYGLLGCCLVLLLTDRLGPARMAFFVLAIIGSDTGAYVAGVLFGRHRMAPRISPHKTWEGVVGALLLSPAAALIVVAVVLPLPWWQAVLAAEAIAVAGILGDLVESAVKRDLGIKDLGGIIPGHGGVMDRVDSYLLAAPVAWLVLALVVPGA
ncbi:MAG: phosphatidate cytidylyltransferase [Propionibacteriaceae bacterium]|jgi:phosphatidate cytidylyltransferase|nr:phosphatidate cytidylyltransferase [Propionibacteriaceae bacterium]